MPRIDKVFLINGQNELLEWDLFKVEERTTAIEWDGHTAHDVAKRLREALQSSQTSEAQDE